jgi:hypothetical protein
MSIRRVWLLVKLIGKLAQMADGCLFGWELRQ